MGKIMTYEQYMTMLSERVVDNTQTLRRGQQQRRNGMEDLYGVCFSSHATEEKDGRYNASFYISLSPDYVYLHRFAFKFVVMPSITEGEDPSEGRDWKISIDGVDITAYLLEQMGKEATDPLFSGEGVYPDKNLEDTVESFYDILDVVSVMIAEGQDPDDTTSNVYKIMRPRFKEVVVSSKKPFSLDSYLYMKYSTINR